MTAGPRLGVSRSNEVRVAATVALAESAERLGFAEAWLPESRHGRGVFTVAAQFAARTTRLGIGIGVAAGARLVTGALIDVFAAAGDPDHVAARLHEYTAAGLRGLLAWHVLGPAPGRGLELLAREVAPKLC